ncbi:MAG TPA: hypothetical protein VFN74_21690 [Chloroflexota bacterium]|nr:hypothetical protein [Chloroflexota bacterium]
MERHTLRAGPLGCVLEDGALRWMALQLPDGGEREVVRGVYAAVRDHNWGTPAPRFTRYDVDAREDSFSARFTAEHVAGDIDLVWDGAIEGSADGTISFSMDALARSTFLTNRLGFCILHPMDAAGSTIEVEHTDGTVERGAFPVQISPHQPFFDIAALRQTFSGVRVETRFEGDVFEMEDQRNWTDASYKTYCTPLARPYPLEVPTGTRIHQRVVVRAIRGVGGGASAASDDPAKLVGGHGGAQRPPSVGVQLGASPTAQELELLRALRLSHLWLTLHLTNPQWESRLAQAAKDAAQIGCPLEIEAVCGDTGAGIDGLAARLAADKIAVSAVHVYPKSGVVTTEAVAKRAREVFTAARLSAPIGGGSRADFVNVNRATLPLPHLDFLTFAVNPQVHAFDDASIMETIEAQSVVLENAQRIAQGRPVRVGPITLRQRLNPAATGPEPPPAPDPRQRTDFCAEWTRRSLQALAGAAALTYFEATGPAGLMEDGQPFPAYHALAGR